jgi:hypothetical protein
MTSDPLTQKNMLQHFLISQRNNNRFLPFACNRSIKQVPLPRQLSANGCLVQG